MWLALPSASIVLCALASASPRTSLEPRAQGGSCTPAWEATFGESTRPWGDPTAVWDDGHGAALYARRSGADGTTPTSHLGRWDGSRWTALGGPMAYAYALTPFDDGTGAALYVGGELSSVGGVGVSYVARWNGTTWSTVGNLAATDPTSGHVTSMTVFDDGHGPRLYVGGVFDVLAGVSAHRIARWDGTAWSALGAGLSGAPLALATFDDGGGTALYAAGGFAQAGGAAANRIARWDGTTWSPVGSGLDEIVRCLCAFDDGSGPALYAGGLFTTAGGQPVAHVARWNGTSWTQVGAGLDHSVRSLAVFDDGSGNGPALFAGGNKIQKDGSTPCFLSKWTGASWIPIDGFQAVGLSADIMDPPCLTAFDAGNGNELYLGPDVRWTGARWSLLGPGLNNEVMALTVMDEGSGSALYAGTYSTAGSGAALHGVGKWDGSTWSSLGEGPRGYVTALATLDTGAGQVLYAAGITKDTLLHGFVDAWDGASWNPLGPVFQSEVAYLTSFDDGAGRAPYAGGKGGELARWDGVQWSRLPGNPARIWGLAAHDDGTGAALYVAWDNPSAGAGQRFIARWDGTAYSSLGPGPGVGVGPLAVIDVGSGPVLLAASAQRLLRWDGALWSSLPDAPGIIEALAAFDDGGGRALHAGGPVGGSGGWVARFDGSQWLPLGGGIAGSVSFVRTLAVFDPPGARGPALIAGGTFYTAVDSGDSYIASWQGCLDTFAPVLSAPEHVYVIDPFGTGPGEIVRFTVTASDDRDPAPSVVCNPPSGSFFVQGTTIVHCTATDSAGNVASAEFPVVVQPKFDRGGR